MYNEHNERVNKKWVYEHVYNKQIMLNQKYNLKMWSEWTCTECL